MNARIVFGFLLGAVLVGAAAFLGVAAYQAGLAQGLIESGQAATVVVPSYGWNGGGWGFLGFFGFLLVLFLIIALVRGAFGMGRGWGRGGWNGGPGYRGGHGWKDGPDGPWDSHAHEVFDEYHRRAHEADRTADRPTDTGSA